MRPAAFSGAICGGRLLQRVATPGDLPATGNFSPDASQPEALNRHTADHPRHREQTVSNARAADLPREIPAILQALAEVERTIAAHDFDRTLYHLVKLRASQINRCGFCIKLHIREAREDGETNERLERVIVFDQVDDFSEREKAALAWTEALTVLDRKTDLAALRTRLRQSFTEKEIGTLTAITAMINLWNRIQISSH
jgi:AhpD family alkylhydroperoxidase